MPQVHKLTTDEVQVQLDSKKSSRKQREERLDRELAQLQVGDYAEVVLDEGENRLTARNRVKAAAARRGVQLTFLRRRQGEILFQVGNPGTRKKAKPQKVTRERDYQDEPTPVVPSLNISSKGKRRK